MQGGPSRINVIKEDHRLPRNEVRGSLKGITHIRLSFSPI
ncbi:hypothetical protein ARNL5_00999 [Anaerolineae bacterium]|nr:hypothetical protein ARNL5_00999 [Anaerolineae bacterium]